MQRIPFTEHEVVPGITLYHLRSDRWKTDFLKLVSVAPVGGNLAARVLAGQLVRHGHDGLRGLDRVTQAMQELYGASFSAYASRTSTQALLSLRATAVAPDYLPGRVDPLAKLAAVMAGCLKRPWFANDRFEKSLFDVEKANLLRSIDAIRDHKSHYAERRLSEETFGSHQLALPAWGTRDQAAALDRGAVALELARAAVESPLLFYAVTRRSAAEVLRLLKRAFVFDPRPAFRRKRLELPPTRKLARRLAEREDIAQSRLAMAFRIKGYDTLRSGRAGILGDVILGGDATSKLFRNIREKRSLAYSIGSTFDERSGTLYILGGADRGRLTEIERLARKEIENIALGKITDEEMATALSTISRLLMTVGDSQEDLAGYHMGRHLAGRPQLSPDELIKRYTAVKRQDIARVYARFRLDAVFRLEETHPGRARGRAVAAEEESDD